MLRRKAGGKVASEPNSDAGEDSFSDDQWSKQDNSALEQSLGPLSKPLRPDWIGFWGSETRGLISCPKSEVYDRASTYLATVNVCAALVLSSISGLATSPLDADSLPEDKQIYGHIFNILAYMSVTIQVCVVMFSTYICLMFAAHGHSPDIIYRALAHLGTLFGSFQVGIFIPLILWLAMMILSAHITFKSFYARWVCTGIVIVIYSTFHLMFTYYTTRAFPRAMWGWLGLTGPWLFFNSRVQSDVTRASQLYLAGAQKGVLAGKDEDHDGHVDASSHHKQTAEETELAKWVDQSLPELSHQSEKTRRQLLFRALLTEGLTLVRLREAAKLPGGFRVLMDMLDLSQEETGVELTRGERLGLATTAMKGTIPDQPQPPVNGKMEPTNMSR